MQPPNFSWRNVLRATPANVFFFFLTLEAIIVALQTESILDESSPKWLRIMYVAIQVSLAKAVLFFGKIKDDAEKQTTVTITSPPNSQVDVETTEVKKDDGDL